jgi:hypothetical protein
MGWLTKMMNKAEAKLEKELNKATGKQSATEPPKFDPENPPTRWEKATIGLNGIVSQVAKIDPDGIDVFCFPGAGGTDFDVYRNLKDTEGLKDLVTKTEPSGPCHMGNVMDQVFKEAFQRGFSERPCSILVLTAGKPDDEERLSQNIANAAKAINKDSDLTVTFVQVGDDLQAETFLKHLDDNLTCISESGEVIDIVDTIKDEDLKKAVGEVKEGGFMKNGGGGALIGAFAGAALGAGGMYLFNKSQAKKRQAGWNGQWKALKDGEEIAVLTVADDLEGSINVEGWAEGGTSTGQYAENEDGYNLERSSADPGTYEVVSGTVEDEHTIAWSDGTRWEEIAPPGESFAAYAAAATAGAATSGAVGYLIQKKFFNNAANNVPSDYVIVMDRSRMMAVPDSGN